MTAHEEHPPTQEVQRLTPTLNFNSIQILYSKFLFPDTSEIRLQETSLKPTVVEKLILQDCKIGARALKMIAHEAKKRYNKCADSTIDSIHSLP